MLSNDNLFPKSAKSAPQVHHHTVDRIFDDEYDLDPSWPMLAVFTLLVLNQIFGNMIMGCL